jgi:hypothetical protein
MSDRDYLISQIKKGIIAYDIPETMTWGKKYRVTVKIHDSLLYEMDSLPNISVIDISSTIKASLTGNSFNIDTTLTSSIQLRKLNSPTVWLWDVTPKKSGVQKLRLKIVCILKRQGYTDEFYDYPVYEVERNIESDIIPMFLNFLSENSKIIIGFLLSSTFLGWIINWFKKLKKNKK